MAHCFDVVTVRVSDKSPVIVGVILGPRPRSTIVSTTDAQRRIVERINFLTSIGMEGNVNPWGIHFSFTDPEVRLSGLSKTSRGTKACHGSTKFM